MEEARKRKRVRARSLDEMAAVKEWLSLKQQSDNTPNAKLVATRSEWYPDNNNNTADHSSHELSSFRQQPASKPILLPSPTSTPQVAQGCLLLPVGLAFWWYWTKRTARRVIRHLLPSSSSSTSKHSSSPANGGCSAAMSCTEGGQPFAEEDVNNDGDGIYVSASHSRDRHQEEEEERGCGRSFSSGSFDQYESWEDVVIEQDHRSNHLRLVQWIKGRNHFGTTRRMRAISRQTLHRRQMRSQNNNDRNKGTPDILVDDDSNLRQRSMPMLDACGSSSSADDHPPPSGEPRTPHDWQCIEDVTGFELCETDYQQQIQQQLPVLPSSASKESNLHSNSCYGCPT